MRNVLFVLFLIFALSACADIPQSPAARAACDEVNDPFEPINRHFYDNTYFFDRLLVRPLAELYRALIPPGIRDRVANIVGNMKEPVILVNDVLQGEFGKAGTTLERFAINTTLGAGGMWDVASGWGMQKQTGDFGQTLASWGIPEGPYLFIPLFGPSSLRDAPSMVVDLALSPWNYVTLLGGTDTFINYEATSFGTDALLRRERNIERVDMLRKESVDPYAHIRSAWRQYRRRQVGRGPQETPKFGEEE